MTENKAIRWGEHGWELCAKEPEKTILLPIGWDYAKDQPIIRRVSVDAEDLKGVKNGRIAASGAEIPA